MASLISLLMPGLHDRSVIRAILIAHTHHLAIAMDKLREREGVEAGLVDAWEPLIFVTWSIYRGALISSRSKSRKEKIFGAHLRAEIDRYIINHIAKANFPAEVKRSMHQNILDRLEPRFGEYDALANTDVSQLPEWQRVYWTPVAALSGTFVKNYSRGSSAFKAMDDPIEPEVAVILDRVLSSISKAWTNN